MSYLQALISGCLQGIAEFLPVSSSGHLILLQNYWSLASNQDHVLFDLLLHLGTLCPIVCVFRVQLLQELRSLQLPRMVLCSMVPTILIALVLTQFRVLFTQSWMVGLMLCLNASILWLGHRLSLKNHEESFSLTKALLIGVAQGFAVIPGLSRSGMTICMALGLKMKLQQTFFYSFALAIPTIILAFSYELLKHHATLSMMDYRVLLLGFISSALVGWASLEVFRRLFTAKHLDFFAIYCIVMGLITLVRSS